MKRAAPIVLVLVLLSALGSGSVPAVPALDGADRSDVTAQATDVGSNPSLSSGERYWRGTTLAFDGSGVVGDVSTASSENRTFQIWTVDDSNGAANVVSSFTVDRDGTAEIDTSVMEGRYVVQYDGDPVYVADGEASVSETSSGEDVTVEASAWRVDRQRVTVSWVDPRVYAAQSATLSVSSNRDSYVVAVSGGGLSFEELTSLFTPEDYADQYDARRSQNEILLAAGRSSRFRINGSVLSPGTTTFHVDVVDTIATESARLSILTSGDGPKLHSVQKRGTVGDLVTASVACSSCYVVLGGPAEGMLDMVALTDQDGDGFVNLTINTRYAGLHPGAAIPSHAAAYSAGPDDVYRYDTGAQFEDRTRKRDTAYIGMVRETFGLDSPGRSAVLGEGDLTIRVTPTDYLISRERYGENRPPPSGPLVLPDENDAATVALDGQSLDGLDAEIAPRVVGGTPSAPTLVDRASPADHVAVGDPLVLGVELSGVFGYLRDQEVAVDSVTDNAQEGLSFELLAPDGSTDVRFDQAARVHVDREANRLWVVLDTEMLSEEGRVQVGTTYTARFSLTGSGPVINDDSGSDPDGYPYLPDGVTESVETTVTVVQPAVEIESPSRGDVRPTDELTVSGTSTLAPGTTLSIEAKALDPYVWSTSDSVPVAEDGTWEVTLDTEDRSGERFSLSATHLGTRMDQTEIRFVNETTATPTPIPTPTDVSTARPDEITPTPTVVSTNATPETPPSSTATASPPETGSAPTDTPPEQAASGLFGLGFLSGLPIGQAGIGLGLLVALFVGVKILRAVR